MSLLKMLSPHAVSKPAITQWTRQLALLLQASLPLAQALQLLANAQTHIPLRTLSLTIFQEVMKGMPLSQALMIHPHYFNRTYCQLIIAAEQSGQLATILQQIAQQQLAQQALHAQLIKALIYPILVLIVGVGVFILLLVWVIPQIASVFAQFNQPLPLFTQFILSLAEGLQEFGLTLLLGNILVATSIYWCNRYHASVAIQLARWRWNSPGAGKLLQSAGCVLFAGTLAILLKAGIPLATAMPTCIPMLKNQYVQQRLSAAIMLINQGHSFSYALGQTWIFPPLAIQMWQIGEYTGKLGDLLQDSANYYQQCVDTITAQLTQLLEPLLLIVLGILMGGTVVAMYLPLFNLGLVLGG